MNKEIQDIFHDVRRHSLTERERADMRNILIAHMSEHPARAPFSIRVADRFASLGTTLSGQGQGGVRIAPAAFAMVLVLGIGTSYAAENALPGDPLYAVKIGINESIQGALAFNEEAQASWQTERIERRLTEAEELVAEGRLSSVAQATLETQIETSVDAFDRNIAVLAATEGDAAVAAAQSDLEASLIGHAEVLVALSENIGADELRPIIRSVLSKAEAAQAARASFEASVVAKRDGMKIREAALEKKEAAAQALSAVKARAASAVASTSSANVLVEDSAAIIEEAITSAEAELEEGNYGGAFSTFQEAIRAVQTVEVHIDASERLNTDISLFSRSRQDTDAAATLMISVEPANIDAAATTIVE